MLDFRGSGRNGFEGSGNYSFLPLLPDGEFHCSSHAMLFNAKLRITYAMAIYRQLPSLTFRAWSNPIHSYRSQL